jgi:tetratricopeptide (TPR) repeat protein
MIVPLAIALFLQPSPAMLRSLFERELAEQQARYGESDARTAQAARDLGLFLVREGDPRSGRAALETAVRVDEKLFGRAARQTLTDLAELASLVPPAEADPIWRRVAASPDGEVSARALGKLGDSRQQAGDRTGATKFYRQALARQESASGADSVRVASRLNALALAVEGEEAIALLERAIRITTIRLGPRRLETASIQMNLAGRWMAAHRAARAAGVAHEAAVTFEELLGPSHSRTIDSLMLESRCLEAAGDRSAAAKIRERVAALNGKP